jgi:hypothetical protein
MGFGEFGNENYLARHCERSEATSAAANRFQAAFDGFEPRPQYALFYV